MVSSKAPKQLYFFIIFVVFIVVSPLCVSSAAQTYVGSKKSDVYHYPSCHYVDNIKPENLISFSSPEEAQSAGYRPCKGCNPPTSSSSGNGGPVSSGKSRTSISCTLSVSNVIVGEPFTVSGTINPSQDGVDVRIVFTVPDGSISEKTVSTDSSGRYSNTYTAQTPGLWTVGASWSGDSQYYGAESTEQSFIVWVDAQPTDIELDQTAICTSIVDGDSFYTSYGEVRLADLDCPEYGQSGYDAARNALSALILNQPIILDIDDLNEKDPYDRYVCVVYVEYNTTHVLNVNHYLLYNGYAALDDFTNNEFSPSTWQSYYPKASQHITCSVSPSQLTRNASVTVSGTITPNQEGQTVHLTYTLPDETLIERDITTASDGRYTDNYALAVLGRWSVSAEVSDSALYGDARSVMRSFQVTKLLGGLSCSLSTSSLSIGDSVTISGALTPAMTGEIITILDNDHALATVITNVDGSFEYSWTPSTADLYYLKASWSGDDEYEEALSAVTSLLVSKLSTGLTCEATTSTLVIGEQVVLSGIINPIRSGVQVTIQQHINSGWITLNYVTTDTEGQYTYVWKPSTSGTYHVRMSVASDEMYGASLSSSLIITIEKITPSLSCDVTSSEITLDDSITISGDLDPKQEGVSIELHCTSDGQVTPIATVTTDNAGNYAYQWTPSTAGSYQIHAMSQSEETYNEAASAFATLTVNAQPMSEWMFLAPVLIIAFVGIFFYQRSRTK